MKPFLRKDVKSILFVLATIGFFAKHRKAISTKNPMVANTNKMLFTSFLKKGFIINKVLRLKIEIEVS